MLILNRTVSRTQETTAVANAVSRYYMCQDPSFCSVKPVTMARRTCVSPLRNFTRGYNLSLLSALIAVTLEIRKQISVDMTRGSEDVAGEGPAMPSNGGRVRLLSRLCLLALRSYMPRAGFR